MSKDAYIYADKSYHFSVPYIRADIVDDLVEALEELCRYADDGDDSSTGSVKLIAKAALAKVRGEE
jgi:hypothetical protein